MFCTPQAMMVHECLPQDAPLAGGKVYDTWATKIYQELSGAPDSAPFAAPCCHTWPMSPPSAMSAEAADCHTTYNIVNSGSSTGDMRQNLVTIGLVVSVYTCIIVSKRHAGTRFTDFLADCNANLAILEFSIRRVLFPVRARSVPAALQQCLQTSGLYCISAFQSCWLGHDPTSLT
jgi:hypothetical protein